MALLLSVRAVERPVPPPDQGPNTIPYEMGATSIAETSNVRFDPAVRPLSVSPAPNTSVVPARRTMTRRPRANAAGDAVKRTVVSPDLVVYV